MPALRHLSHDADKVAEALPGLLEEHGLAGAPCVLWGRSIGATCAIHLAAKHGEHFKGCVIESGLMDIKSLPMVMQMSFMLPGGPALLQNLPDPLGTLGKLGEVTIPLLVIHGDHDEIVPVSQGQQCHDDAASEDKAIEIFENGDHNGLSFTFADQYNAVFQAFVAKCK